LSVSDPPPVTGSFTVTAQPSDFTPTSVEFRIDTSSGAPYFVASSAPFAVTLDASNLSIGTHTVWAKATDGTRTLQASISVSASRPNVVFVLNDDMRTDEIERVISVKPDGGFAWMAHHATRFSKLWMSDNLCCPGRTTALTGQTAFNHKVFENDAYPYLPETVAKWLQGAGYCTGFTGRYLNHYNASNRRPPGWTYWEPLVKDIGDMYSYSQMKRDGSVAQPGTYVTDRLSNVTRAQITDCLNANKPAFTAFWPTAPHFGTTPEPDYAAVSVPWSPSDPSFNEADISDKPQWLQRWHPTPRADAETYYQAQEQTRVRTLMSVDDALLSFVNLLSSRGQLDDTIFILSSDNGWFLGEHRIDSRKRLAYEAGQAAFWIAGEGFPARAESDTFDMNIDIAPTIVRAANATAGLTMDGRALQDVLADPGHGHNRFLPIHVPTEGESATQPAGDAVRTWRYKYVSYVDGSEELYDLSADPYELTNRAADPTMATVKSQMITLLSQAKACKGDTCRVSAPASLQ
jgi:arylsulfatase A-like enzyme